MRKSDSVSSVVKYGQQSKKRMWKVKAGPSAVCVSIVLPAKAVFFFFFAPQALIELNVAFTVRPISREQNIADGPPQQAPSVVSNENGLCRPFAEACSAMLKQTNTRVLVRPPPLLFSLSFLLPAFFFRFWHFCYSKQFFTVFLRTNAWHELWALEKKKEKKRPLNRLIV